MPSSYAWKCSTLPIMWSWVTRRQDGGVRTFCRRRRLAQSRQRVQACARFNSRSSIISEYFERNIMQLVIEKLLTDFERGGMTRRQLALSLTALVTAAQAAPKENLRAVTLNHVTVRVPDVHRTSRFYQEFFGMPLKQHSKKTHILGVGKSFFGIEQKGTPAELDHYDFGIAGFDADEAIEKIKARKLKLEPGGTKE